MHILCWFFPITETLKPDIHTKDNVQDEKLIPGKLMEFNHYFTRIVKIITC